MRGIGYPGAVFAFGLVCALGAANSRAVKQESNSVTASAKRGAEWLASVQGADGGWGQDGAGTSVVMHQRQMQQQAGNDVANTAVAVNALVRAGGYRDNVRRGVEFMLRHVEASPDQGLAITSVTGTQIQRKLGPFIDTFLTSQLFAELDGQLGDAQINRRVHAALVKCTAKIEQNQKSDGSWNHSGGWAPVIGTSIASKSLDAASARGVKVKEETRQRVNEYTQRAQASAAPAAEAAGVSLYSKAQAIEQMSRSDKDRSANKAAISGIAREMKDERMVAGFGSMGGEEFFSYLNVSDSLRRVGGDEWKQWNGSIQNKLVALQNNDGTWVGHHCITGRVAVTGAAILTLLADRAPVLEARR